MGEIPDPCSLVPKAIVMIRLAGIVAEAARAVAESRVHEKPEERGDMCQNTLHDMGNKIGYALEQEGSQNPTDSSRPPNPIIAIASVSAVE